MLNYWAALLDRNETLKKIALGGALALGVGLFLILVTTPLSFRAQILLGAVMIVVAGLMSNGDRRYFKFLLAASAILASTRYIYWRFTETLEFRSIAEAILGYGMVGAELYLWIVLLLSFFQNLWSRDRKVAPLPKDPAQWPTVDIFIPTYNEPESVVRTTVIAAQAIDYPKDKLNVYLLDDGRRDSFRVLAQQLGATYITRADNQHAKAGNLNNALAQSDGELIAIFDCDHVPNRAFLQFTAGWFLKDPKMAMLQTPHHFYNKDPFEKNLSAGDQVPNEGALFYGLLQNGNDFWNASFFCGSCALLRRTALLEIDGIAVETVTEDAHTSLKMQRNGWNTGFLALPLAAGLATDSLAIHIGQRLRWARGMIQIFRLDNPFMGKGLSLPQRVCYANAMVHFFFALPRFILLSAPLAYLIFGQHVIRASAFEILAYAAPHLIIATITSNTLQGRHRHPFWAEIYETVLSFHLLRPTLSTLLFPKRGKFNVTSKGGQKSSDYFDWKVVMWPIALVVALGAATGFGLLQLASGGLDAKDVPTMWINVFWAFVSSLYLGVAIAVAREGRELRTNPRVRADLPAFVAFENGYQYSARTKDISVDGVSLTLASDTDRDVVGENVWLEFDGRVDAPPIGYKVVDWHGDNLRLQRTDTSLAAERAITQLIFGRANAWKGWQEMPTGRVVRAVRDISGSIVFLLSWGARRMGKKLKRSKAVIANTATALTVALIAAAMLIGEARAQDAALPLASAEQTAAVQTDVQAETRNLNLLLNDFGILSPIRLSGSQSTRGVSFTIRSDEVVRQAKLILRIAYSPVLDPSNSQLSIALNGEVVHAMALDPIDGTAQTIELDVNPYLFLADNDLTFSLRAARADGAQLCAADDEGSVWAQISNASEMALQVSRLDLADDLQQLPLPFFDRRDATELSLPFVFMTDPSVELVEDAAAVASYWGALASYRGATFPVVFDKLPEGNGVVFALANDLPNFDDLSTVIGPTLAVVENPNSSYGKLLVITGRNQEELSIAAQTLSVGAEFLSGKSAVVSAPLLQPRTPYDAPNWIATDRPVKIGELVGIDALQGRGISPGTLNVPFATAPDLFLWREDGIALDFDFKTPGAQWIDKNKSRLDVLINDRFLKSVPATHSVTGPGAIAAFTQEDLADSRTASIPPYLIFGENQLQFYFDLHPADADACPTEPAELRTTIDPNSTIDLSKIHRFTQMPNLAFFAQAGFPYSVRADLSETAVVLPVDYGKHDLEALFRLIGAIGDKTGYPALRLDVVTPREIETVAERDLIVIGTFDQQPLYQTWSARSPYTFVNDNVVARVKRPLQNRLSSFIFGDRKELPQDEIVVPQASLSAAITSYESPLSDGRTVLAFMAPTGEGLVRLADAVRSDEESPLIQGDFVIVSGNEIRNYKIASTYNVGSLPVVTMIQWRLSEDAWMMPFIFMLAISLLAAVAYLSMRARSKKLNR